MEFLSVKLNISWVNAANKQDTRFNMSLEILQGTMYHFVYVNILQTDLINVLRRERVVICLRC